MRGFKTELSGLSQGRTAGHSITDLISRVNRLMASGSRVIRSELDVGNDELFPRRFFSFEFNGMVGSQ